MVTTENYVRPAMQHFLGDDAGTIMEQEVSPFLTGTGIVCDAGKDGFFFEADFVEDNIRCIPMIVRFKLDLAGIKLKLAEWSRFEAEERKQLSVLPCVSKEEKDEYKNYLQFLVRWRTGNEASILSIDADPLWLKHDIVPDVIITQAAQFGWTLTPDQWNRLSYLQRFALIKLSKPGHENRNFPRAFTEFGLAAIEP